MTQTGATGKGTTGVGTGSTTKGISTAVWATALLQKLASPVTANNVANLQRLIGVESSGNQAGFLRDNNPFNLNTGRSPHGNLYAGGQIVQEFGIYVQTFNSVEAGISATAGQFRDNPVLLAALKNNAPPAMFGAALGQSAWKSGSYANATKFPTLKPFNAVSAFPGPVHSSGNPKGWFGQWVEPGITGSVFGLKNNPIVPITNGLIAPFKATVSVGKFLGDLTNPAYLKNVGIFALGFVLVSGGVVLLFASTKSVQNVEKTAARAA